MTNFSAKIVNNAVGALLAQQAVIATTANNIANVNTPGYSKRTIDLETRVSGGHTAGVNIGNGVSIGRVSRIADEFLEKQLREAIGDQSKAQVLDEFLGRAASVFNVSGDQPNVGTELTAFYNAVNDLTANPSSIELRQNVIDRANDLVHQIKTTYDTLADLQTEADQRIANEVDVVNTLSEKIAELNGRIVTQESSGGTAADERDRREALLQQLAGKIGVSLVPQSDGSVNVALANGFAIVNGTTARPLEVTNAPSFSSGTVPPSLSGGVLSYIVYDYGSSATPSHINLTSTIQSLGGTLGGLLEFRGHNDISNTSAFDANGKVVELATRIEAITRELLTTLNTTYLGPDETAGGAHQPSARDLNGNPPAVYGLFDFQFGGLKDADSNGLPDDLAALSIDNFSSILQLAIDDPAEVAAARDNNPVAGAVTTTSGDGSNMEALSLTLRTAQAMSAGPTYSVTATMDEAFNQTVGVMGNMQSSAKTDLSVSQSKFAAAAASRDQVSAVSLDEEFTSLIRFQKAYEASARMVKVANELLDQVLQLL